MARGCPLRSKIPWPLSGTRRNAFCSVLESLLRGALLRGPLRFPTGTGRLRNLDPKLALRVWNSTSECLASKLWKARWIRNLEGVLESDFPHFEITAGFEPQGPVSNSDSPSPPAGTGILAKSYQDGVSRNAGRFARDNPPVFVPLPTLRTKFA